MKINRSIVLISAALAGAVSGHAATNNFIVPSFRGLENSQVGYWENFSTAAGAPGNTADRPGSTTGAILTQNNPGAFLTGTFNIYNPGGLSEFTLSDTTPFALGTVVLQTRTLGSEIDYGSVSLSYTDGTGTHSLAPSQRLELDRGTVLGASVSTLWQWDLSGVDASSYSLSFKAAGESLSFDAMTVDTWNQMVVVPEPSTLALGSVGILFWLMRRRRQ